MPVFGRILNIDPGHPMGVLEGPLGPDTQEISHDFGL